MPYSPKISIITPSFNQGQYIEQTIDSVLSQNYPNLEYIIIDGGSTDNTVEIIRKYEKHLAYWVSEPDRGQSHAINKGLGKASGEIFNWINSDDYLEPNALLEVGQSFISNPNLLLLCGYGRIFDEDKLQADFRHRTTIYNSVAETIVNEQLNQQGMFYKTSVVRELGGINESLRFVMDLELWFRFLLRYGIKNMAFSNNTLGSFRLHSQSKTTGYESGFRNEVFQLFTYLFTMAKLPTPVIQAFETNHRSYTPQTWYTNYLQSKELLSHISRKYLFDFYKQHHTQAAKIAYIEQLRNRQIKLNKAYISLFIRLFITNKKYGQS